MWKFIKQGENSLTIHPEHANYVAEVIAKVTARIDNCIMQQNLRMADSLKAELKNFYRDCAKKNILRWVVTPTLEARRLKRWHGRGKPYSPKA